MKKLQSSCLMCKSYYLSKPFKSHKCTLAGNEILFITCLKNPLKNIWLGKNRIFTHLIEIICIEERNYRSIFTTYIVLHVKNFAFNFRDILNINNALIVVDQ